MTLVLMTQALLIPNQAPVDPVYALVTQTSVGSDPVSYIVVTDSLSSTTTLSLANGVEVAGRAYAYGIPESGSIFVGTGSSGTLVRYSLRADGTVATDGDVSFGSRGVTGFGEYQSQMVFFSDTKAYYFDPINGKVSYLESRHSCDFR